MPNVRNDHGGDVYKMYAIITACTLCDYILCIQCGGVCQVYVVVSVCQVYVVVSVCQVHVMVSVCQVSTMLGRICDGYWAMASLCF